MKLALVSHGHFSKKSSESLALLFDKITFRFHGGWSVADHDDVYVLSLRKELLNEFHCNAALAHSSAK